MSGGSESGVRCSFNMNHEGMDALLGELYKREGNLSLDNLHHRGNPSGRGRGSASFHGEPSERRRRASVDSQATGESGRRGSRSFHGASTSSETSEAEEPQPSKPRQEDNGLRYSISLDRGGMTAIMGSLYDSCRSLHHREPGDDGRGRDEKQGKLRRRNSAHGFLDPRHAYSDVSRKGRESTQGRQGIPSPGMTVDALDVSKEGPTRRNSEVSLEDLIRQPSQMKPDKRPIRRRATIDSVSVSEASLDASARSGGDEVKSLRRSTGDDFNCGKSTMARRVSWSHHHKVSLIDQDKSPDHMVTMNEQWEEAKFAPLPFGSSKEGNGSGDAGSLKPPANHGLDRQSQQRAGQAQDRHQQQRRQQHRQQQQQPRQQQTSSRSNPQVQQANHQDGQANPQEEVQSIHQSPQTTTRVISLPCTDQRGVRGEYTGEVNADIQPHGEGMFTAYTLQGVGEGSTSVECTWRDGRLVSARVPVGVPLERANGRNDRTGPFRRANSSDTHGTGRTENTGATVDPVSSASHGRSGDANGEDDADEEEGVEHSPTPTLKSTVSTTALEGYHLGHTIKCRSHMVVPPNERVAIDYAYTLKSLDFAFVLRSNGNWSYSIVADRPFAEDGPSIRFVLDEKGSTKTIRRKYWGRGIRLINNGLNDVGGDLNTQSGGTEEGLEEGHIDQPDRDNNDQVPKYSRKDLEDAMEAKLAKKKLSRHLERAQPSRCSLNSDQAVVEGASNKGTLFSAEADSSEVPTDSTKKTSPQPSRCSVNSEQAVVEGLDQPPAVEKDGMSKKMSRRKSAPNNNGSPVDISFTSACAVHGSFDKESPQRGFNQDCPSRGFDEHRERESSILENKVDAGGAKVGSPDRKLGRNGKPILNGSDRSMGTFGSNLKAILSLDYLGMLDDSLTEGRDQPMKSKSFYHGDVPMRTDAVGSHEHEEEIRMPRKSKSYHHGDKPAGHHHGRNKDKKKKIKSKSRSSSKSHSSSKSPSFHSSSEHLHEREGTAKSSASFHSGNQNRPVGIMKSSSSFHTVGWDEVERRTRDRSARKAAGDLRASLQDLLFGEDDELEFEAPPRRGSSASHHVELCEDLKRLSKKERKMQQRRSSACSRGSVSGLSSAGSVGSNVSSLSTLLREIYSPGYLAEAENKMNRSSSLHSMATIVPN